jgi:GntR family transcriptional regulator
VTARNDWFGTVTGKVAFNPDLSHAAVRVYMVLVMHRNRDDDTCFPSNETVAKHTGMSLRSVERAIPELVEAGVIEREPRYVDGRQTTSMTRITDH